MQSDTLEERYAINFCFKLRKNATETYGMLQTAFRPSFINQASEWHKRFKEGRESVRGDERCGTSKEGNTPDLVGTVEQEHCSRRRLLRRGLEFHVYTIYKSPDTKNVLKLIVCTSECLEASVWRLSQPGFDHSYGKILSSHTDEFW